MGNDQCCSLICLKNVVNFLNLSFLILGLGIVTLGIWNLSDHKDILNILPSITYIVLVYLFTSSGIILIITSIIGCSSVLKENQKALLLYTFLLLLAFVLKIMIGSVGLIYEDNLGVEFDNNLNNTMLNQYEINFEVTEAIDNIQQKFRCCGAIQFEDWMHSKWIENNRTQNLVPDSCCKTITFECGVRDHPSNIHYDGCLDRMQEDTVNRLLLLVGVAFGVGIVEAIAITLVIKLYFNIKEEEEFTELRKFLNST